MVVWGRFLQVSSLAMVCAVGGCSQGRRMADNPDYQAWAGYAPGSYVAFEGIEDAGGRARPVRIVERLIAVEPDKVLLERTILELDPARSSEPRVARRIEPAKIAAVDDPRTHPKGRASYIGDDQVEIGGGFHDCRVMRFDVGDGRYHWTNEPGAFSVTVWRSSTVPGGIARIMLNAAAGEREYGVTGEVVEFRSVTRHASRNE